MTDVYYRSAVRSCQDSSDDQPSTLMLGIVQRLPRDVLDNGDKDALQRSVEEGQRLLKPRLLSDGTFVEPDPDKPLERYEVYDAEGNDDDLLVMWRVPMRAVKK